MIHIIKSQTSFAIAQFTDKYIYYFSAALGGVIVESNITLLANIVKNKLSNKRYRVIKKYHPEWVKTGIQFKSLENLQRFNFSTLKRFHD